MKKRTLSQYINEKIRPEKLPMQKLVYEPVAEKPAETQIKFNRLARPLATAYYS
jgi:hypothetical protein